MVRDIGLGGGGGRKCGVFTQKCCALLQDLDGLDGRGMGGRWGVNEISDRFRQPSRGFLLPKLYFLLLSAARLPPRAELGASRRTL